MKSAIELARVGSQLFVFGLATYDQTAVKRLFDTFTIRLSAQPLSKKIIGYEDSRKVQSAVGFASNSVAVLLGYCRTVIRVGRI
jgi:hypothetical protein